MEPIFRPAVPSDEADVSALLAASYSVLLADAYDASVLANALPLISRANPTLLASGTYHLAVKPGEYPIACGGWSSAEPGTGKVEQGLGHIRHFATHPDHIGIGLARRIMQICLGEMRGAGVRRVQCLSTLNGVGFYSAMGFMPQRPLDVALPGGIGFPSVLMVRLLEH